MQRTAEANSFSVGTTAGWKSAPNSGLIQKGDVTASAAHPAVPSRRHSRVAVATWSASLERLFTPWTRKSAKKAAAPKTVAVEAYRVGA